MNILPKRVRRFVRRMVLGNDSFPVVSPDLNLAMIVGAQRSGTTWLQLLCAAHPKIAGGEELHLFSRYLSPMVTSFYADRRAMNEAIRAQGLPCVLTFEEFHAALRQFSTTCLSKLLRLKPGAELAIEKTPDHVLHLHYIRFLFPKAKVIHVIRDPRDVVVSQLAAAESWGGDWAAKNPAQAAERWVEWVTTGRKFANSLTYTEVRYETLHSEGPRELARVYDFLGHPLPIDQVEHIYNQFTMANIKAGRAPNVLVMTRAAKPAANAGAAAAAAQGANANAAASSNVNANTNGNATANAKPGLGKAAPAGFFRKGKAGGWRESLSADDVRDVERICGHLMAELGYAPASASAPSSPSSSPPPQVASAQ